MYKELNSIIKQEITALEKLLNCLNKQHECILENHVFKMEGIVDEIQNCNREVAEIEIKRREITKGEAMSKIVAESRNNELELNYREARKLVEDLKVQKETNEVLIKQGLGYSLKILQLLNPDKRAKTYSSYGRVR